MKIKSISLKNWRSFDEEGIKIDNIKNINVIIGANNSGKSNLFKYLYRLRNMVKPSDLPISDNINSILNSKYSMYTMLPYDFNYGDIWAWKDNTIECSFTIEVNDDKWEFGEPYTLSKCNKIELQAVHDKKLGRSSCSVLYDNMPLIKSDENKNIKVYDIEHKEYKDMISSIKESYDTFKYWHKLSESMIFVDPCRHYNRESSKFMESDFDGSNIIASIVDINVNDKVKWIKYRESIKKWLSEILMEDIAIDVNGESGLDFNLSRGNERIILSLNELGTGVSQIFMLLSYLFINKEKNMNIFIEEPECNLHPDALIKFMKILEEEFQNNTFFITTHSSSLIDKMNENWSIYRVFSGDKHQSLLDECKGIVNVYNVLDDLGIKASQLLQSNMIIWIEGPSDRIYINKWITDLSDNKLVEGIHYSYIMYGGSNLKLYDIMGSEECINIVSTSRYSYIVCDSDKKEKNSELKGRVKNIINSITNLNEVTEKDINDYIKVWVTKGREIENYIPKDCLKDILSKENFTKKYFKGSNYKVDLQVNKELINNMEFSMYDSFDVFFAEMYRKDGEKLSIDEIKNISKHYTNKKVDIAKEVVKVWEKDYYEKLDLKEKVLDLIKMIKRANKIIS